MTLFPSRQEAFPVLFSRRFLFPPGVIIWAGSLYLRPLRSECTAFGHPYLPLPSFRQNREVSHS
jgi:hypothetical protein